MQTALGIVLAMALVGPLGDTKIDGKKLLGRWQQRPGPNTKPAAVKVSDPSPEPGAGVKLAVTVRIEVPPPTLEFAAGGKLTVTVFGDANAAAYELRGSKLVVREKHGDEVLGGSLTILKLTDSELVMIGVGTLATERYVRIKDK